MNSDVREIIELLDSAGALAVPVHVMHRSPERVFACFTLDEQGRRWGALECVVLQGAAPPRQAQILTGPQASVLRQLDVDGAVPDHLLNSRVVTALASLNLVRLRGRYVEATALGVKALDIYETTMARSRSRA